MLRKIGLTNFKCWKKLEIELAPITLLFGANSSGKTSVLQSLLMLKQTVFGFDPRQYMNFGGRERDYVGFGSYQDLVYGRNARANVGLKLTWDLSSEAIDELAVARWVEDNSDKSSLYPSMSMQYSVSWGFDNDVHVSVLAYKFIEDGRDQTEIALRREKENQYSLTHYVPKPGANPGEYDVSASRSVGPPENCHLIRSDLLLQVARDHISTSPAFIALEFAGLLDRLRYMGPLRERANRNYPWTGNKPSIIEPDGSNTIQAFIASAREGRYLLDQTTRILKEMDLVEDFDVKPIDENQRLYEATATVGGANSSLADVGFGVSQVLPVVALLFSAPPGSIVLLEQPELHLHPNAQSLLADLLLHVAETRNLQLIVESHSEHVLRRLQARIAEGQSKFANPENIKMYFCEPGEGGSTISEVELDRFGQIANWPEKFLGDISGELHTIAKAAIRRRREELENYALTVNELCPQYIKNRTKQT